MTTPPSGRTDVPMQYIDLATHCLTGWPRKATHACGGSLMILHATVERANYECSGCWQTVVVQREVVVDAG